MTFRLILTILGAVMGSVQHGFNLGVINSPEVLIKRFMNESHSRRYATFMSESETRHLWALAVSIFSIGGCCGGLFAGKVATLVGRKRGCLLNVSLGVVASILMVFSKEMDSFEAVVVARFILGCHSGLYSGLVLMYLSEISTPKTRGSIGTIHQVGILSGMFVGQVLGFPDLLGTADRWNFLLGFCFVPCLLQFIILPFCPESPRYILINKKNESKCREALTILRGHGNVDLEVMEIASEMNTCRPQMTFLDLVGSPSLRRPLVTAVVLQVALQASGIGGIFFYSTNLFRAVTKSHTVATYTTSAVGCIMVVMSFVTIPLMDRLGRRPLQLTGLAGISACGLLISVTMVFREQVGWFQIATIVFVLFFVIFFTIGPGCVSWIMAAELFSHNARPLGMSLCVITNNLSNFLVGFIFPSLQNYIRDYTFLPFSFLSFIFFTFTFFFVPETKGKTFEEISAIWKKQPQKLSTAAREVLDKEVFKQGLDNPAFVENYKM